MVVLVWPLDLGRRLVETYDAGMSCPGWRALTGTICFSIRSSTWCSGPVRIVDRGTASGYRGTRRFVAIGF